MNWKEQTKIVVQNLNAADDFIPDKETVITNAINYHISTEIIEKLINDIPDEIDWGYPYGTAHLKELKSQLKDKWLNN